MGPDGPQLPLHLSHDARFQEILARKREEYKRQLDDQIRDKQMAQNSPPDAFMNNEMPSFPSQPPQGLDFPPPSFMQNNLPSFPPPSQLPPSMMPNMPPPPHPADMPSSLTSGMAPSFPSDFPPAMSQPGQGPSEAEIQKLKKEEYRRELESQIKRKEALDHEKFKVEPPKNFEKPAYEVISHALPMEPSEPTAFGAGSRASRRTDITTEKKEASDLEKEKQLAYKEELRLQMEQQKAKKEAEKAKLKMEEERIEKELEV